MCEPMSVLGTAPSCSESVAERRAQQQREVFAALALTTNALPNLTPFAYEAGAWLVEMEAARLGVPHLIARTIPKVEPIAEVVLPPEATLADRQGLRRRARWSLRDFFEEAGDVACDLVNDALPRARSRHV